VVRADVAVATAVQQRDETDAYVSASKAAFDAALASFRRGLSTVQEVESGNAALAEAIAARESANADLQVAIAQLALATGAISVDATDAGDGRRPQDEHARSTPLHPTSPSFNQENVHEQENRADHR